MNQKLLLGVLGLYSSLSAFAAGGGGSSIGPSACSYAKYVCTSSDNNTSVCIYPDNKALVVLALANGGDFSNMYDIQGIAEVGDITTFEYSDLTLKLCSGFDLTDGKLPAYLTYSSAGLSNLPVRCTQNTAQ